MSPRSIGLHDDLQAYVADHTTAPDAIQQALIDRTQAMELVSGMQISPEQGELLTMLTRLVRPTVAVEVGTFTGYSALSIARGLEPGARLLCCDVSEEWTAIAREHWSRAGVDDRIELHIGPAADTLAALGSDVEIDLAFIDADKGGYVEYYEQLLSRLSPDGVILVDNTLWSGNVVDHADTSADTEAIRRFNDHVAGDDRTRQVIVPIGDGLTVIMRS